MPDKYPLTPGHTLIISKDHLSCYGAASGELHAELEEAAEKASGFLRSAYGNPIFMWENGVAGQSVHHAHLHLIPFPGARDDEVIPAEIGEHADVSAIDAWDAVRAHFDQHRSYRYLRFGAERRVLPGHSPVLRALVRWMSQGTGLRYGPRGWIKTTTPSDVIEANRRWEAWQRTASHAVLSAESRL
jgi:diadenosine tetraphosphate (Ap4A) HIT family hydrolase